MLNKITVCHWLKQSVFIYILLLISSCKQNSQVDVSTIRLVVKAGRFEQDLFSTRASSISYLKNKYPGFFDLFCYKIISVGTPDTVLLKERLKGFATDSDIVGIYSASEKEFHDFNKINQQLTDAFRYYKYYFPQKTIPTVYTYISGFNYAVVAADSALGIGLDMYLGADAKYYPALQYPRYKIARMRKEYLPVDCIRGWIQSEWIQDESQNDLLSGMVYSGKILYCLDMLMPGIADSIKTGYTSSQLKWCKTSEKSIWSFFIDQQLLFSNDQNQIAKFINDGPTTNGFPKESPGAVGQWLGWRIIQAYMKNNPAVTLEQMMNTKDSRKILNESKYKPEK
jgi:gliding motility-associated lipoprotein GldB